MVGQLTCELSFVPFYFTLHAAQHLLKPKKSRIVSSGYDLLICVRLLWVEALNHGCGSGRFQYHIGRNACC